MRPVDPVMATRMTPSVERDPADRRCGAGYGEAMGNDVRSAVPADRDRVAATLADAFAHDPILSWMFGASPASADRITRLFDIVLREEFRKPAHLVETMNDASGAAIWMDVGDSGMSNADIARNAPQMLSLFRTGIGRTLRLMSAMDATHPKELHRYLYFVGVRQATQGSGVGAALLASVLDRCDADGIPAYLENSNPANAAFYARHGFVERPAEGFPKGAPPMMPMWREPRSA
jgi:GNAT superfamily N-acetyltransferase